MTPQVALSITNTMIELKVPVDLLSTLPSFCYASRRKNTYCCSVRNLPEILQMYRSISSLEEIDKEKTPTIWQLYYNEMQRRMYSDDIKHSSFPATDEEGRLWEHQIRGAALAKVNSRYAFFYDTRTGKTRMAYQIILDALREGRIKRSIIFVPSSIIPNWLEDAKVFPELSVAAYYKDAKTKQHALNTPCNVFIMSVELSITNVELLNSLNAEMCFFDESSKLKSHTSQISKFMREYSCKPMYFYLLSATPAPNGYHEYYTQMMCIDPYIFPAARTHFVSKYFINYSRNPNYEKLAIKPECKDEFMQLIESYAIYVDQEVMPMAGKKFIDFTYQLPEDARKFYDSMCNTMSLEIHGTEITVDMATAIRSKLQQIASGFIMNTDNSKQIAVNKALNLPVDDSLVAVEIISSAGAARLSCVHTILKNHPDEYKFIIWANYKQEFNDLAVYFNLRQIKFGVLNGSTALVDKEQIIEDFKHGNTNVLLCHPLSVGMGKNFTESHIAIYYSLNDSWEAFKQSSERIAGHVTVQPKECLYYIIQAEDTINGIVYENLKNKREQSYGMLEHMQSRSSYVKHE